MKEKIILTSSLNGKQLLKTLAYFENNNIATKILNSKELSNYILFRENIISDKRLINNREETFEIFNLLKDIKYFSSTNFSHTTYLVNTINNLRHFILNNEKKEIKRLNDGPFKDKNEAIINLYDKYNEIKENNNLIDEVDLIRLAIENSSYIDDIEFYELKEFPNTLLENELLNRLSNGQYNSISIFDLFNKGDDYNINYKKAYDYSNELENVLYDIYSNNRKLDECLIVVTDLKKYSQLIYDYSLIHNIPISFGTGLPLSNSNSLSVLRNFSNIDNQLAVGIDLINSLIKSNSFNDELLLENIGLEDRLLDELINVAGRLHLTGKENEDKIINDYINVLNKTNLKQRKKIELIDNEKDKEKELKIIEDSELVSNVLNNFSNELNKGVSYIVETYTKRRNSNNKSSMQYQLDETGIRNIVDEIREYEEICGGNYNEIIDSLSNKMIVKGKQIPGHLYVCGINQAITSIRKYNYVLGLSADIFPGSPKENYILLDDDYILFDNNENMPLSENLINKKKDNLYNFVDLNKHLGCDITLSYASYNMATIKTINGSSCLFEIYQKENGEVTLENFNKNIKNTNLFNEENNININSRIGLALLKNKQVTYKINNPEKESKQIERRIFSPSAIEDYLKCPRMFYYKRILSIYPEQEDDVYRVIAANEYGTLAHSMMEELANNDMPIDDFMNICEEAFEDYLKMNIPIFEKEAKKSKKEFMDMMINAYNSDPHNKVISAEKKSKAKHESGIIIDGYPDRVEINHNGNNIIADYKTGTTEKKENDFKSCIQVILYAYIMSKLNIDIKACEYRFLKLNKIIPCAYDDEKKKELSDTLNMMVQDLENKNFPPIGFNPRSDACKYCAFTRLCTQKGSEEVNG